MEKIETFSQPILKLENHFIAIWKLGDYFIAIWKFENHLVAKGHFRSTWRIWQGVAMGLRNHFAAKWSFRSRVPFSQPISQRGGVGLRNYFAAKWQFRSEVAISQRTCWGCEMVSQQRADFAEASFRLRNFADPCFSLVFTLFLAPNNFSSISLQFLLILIIQKPILNQNKLELKH